MRNKTPDERLKAMAKRLNVPIDTALFLLLQNWELRHKVIDPIDAPQDQNKSAPWVHGLTNLEVGAIGVALAEAVLIAILWAVWFAL